MSRPKLPTPSYGHLFFNLFLLNDLYNFLVYPSERGNTTLLAILLGAVDTSALTAFTRKMWFWYGILGLGATFVLGTSLETCCTLKTSTDEGYVEDLIEQLEGKG